MDEVSRGVRYLFILALFLIAAAYWAGVNQLGQTAISGINTIGLTYTGRDSSGKFANYPGGFTK